MGSYLSVPACLICGQFFLHPLSPFPYSSVILLRQEAALAWQVAIKHEARAHDDWLIRSNPDADRHISNAIESRTTGCRHGPIEIPRVSWRKSYHAGSGFTRIDLPHGRAGNRHAGQIVSKLVQNVDCDVGSSRTSVKNVKIRSGTAGGVGKMRRGADPNEWWST